MNSAQMCDRLYQMGYISKGEVGEVKMMGSREDKNRELLDIIGRKTQEACKCLLTLHDKDQQPCEHGTPFLPHQGQPLMALPPAGEWEDSLCIAYGKVAI